MAFERARTAALALVSLFALEGVALADPSAAERETARGLMADGRYKRDQNDLAAALKSFEAADAIMRVPTTGLEVARTQLALGLLVEGRDTLRRVLLIAPRADDPSPFHDARTAAEKLDSDLAERIPAIMLVVRTPPSPPSLTVDGIKIPMEAAGAPFRLNPGRHEVTARAGSSTAVRHVGLREREVVEVVLDFGSVAAGTASSTDVAPPPPDAPSGSSGGSGTLTFIGFSVGGVGVAAGVVAGLLAVGRKNAAQDGCADGRCPPATWEDIERAETFATVSTISFVAGGVGIGVGIVSLVMSINSAPAASSQTRLRVEPWIGASSAGLRGSF